jgi:DNA replication and repair protein RecF
MQINTLQLTNWRNHKNYKFDFGEVTILVGPNASGKTNFLEAIYYLACGRSFRGKDDNLINWEHEFTRITGEIQKEDKIEELIVILEKAERLTKTVKIKEQKVATAKLLGHLNCVLFTPEEIELIYTLPEARRRYLNLILSQSDINYAHNLIHFRRSLDHRNSLLKKIFLGKAKDNELEIWDGKLTEYAAFIIEKRGQYIELINKYLPEYYKNLSGKNQTLQIVYKPSVSMKEGWAGMLTRLTESRAKDILCRVTSIGPHRDDIAFLMDGRNVVEFASRGEFRTAILALKLAEVEFLKEKTGESPVLLLDDVFSELDESRRDLLSQIFTNQQTIVTTTDLDHVSKNIISTASVVEMKNE